METSEAALSALSKLVNRVDKLKDDIAGTEVLLTQQKAELQGILCLDLPEALERARLPSVTTEGQRVISRKQIVSGSWPKDDVGIGKAVDWLVQHKLEGLLKCTVSVEFDKGDREAALEFYNVARSNNKKKKAEFKESVHHQTLNAAFRERLDKGLEVPVELFNGYVAWVGVITDPKGKK